MCEARGGAKAEACSPYVSQPDQQWQGVRIDDWKPGGRLQCRATGLPFYLPDPLPALDAIPMANEEATFRSPFAPGQAPFRLETWNCVPGTEFNRPGAPGPLRVPEWPKNWIFKGTVEKDRPFRVRSPFLKAEVWQDVPREKWRAGETVVCGQTNLPFQLPAADEMPLPRAAAVTDRPGHFESPYAPGREFTLEPWQCFAGAKIPDGVDGRDVILGSIPKTWRFEAEVRQREGVLEVKNPYVHEAEKGWQNVAASEWRKGGEIVSRENTAQKFVLPRDLPVLHVHPGRQPLRVRSPFAGGADIEIAEGDWQPGREVWVKIIPGLECLVQLPHDLPPLPAAEPRKTKLPPATLPPQQAAPPPPPVEIAPPPVPPPVVAPAPEEDGIDAVALEGKGSIRSPYVPAETRVEVPGPKWLAGERVQCPATKRFFRLPVILPPLIGREGQKPGTIWSPYSDRLIDVRPAEWEKDGLVKGEGLPLPIRLPATLHPLEGKVDRNRPGYVESPFDPGKPIALEFSQWKPGALVACSQTRKSFVLPAELPEWILEGEAIQDHAGTVRSPYGHHRHFEVAGPDWKAGEIVHCPETNLKVRLPKDLPPMVGREGDKPGTVWSPYTERLIDVKPEEWEPDGVVERKGQPLPIRLPSTLGPLEGKVERNRPGFVDSPFAPGKPIAVDYNQWKPGTLIACPETGKSVVLPAELPEWILEGEALEDRPGSIRSPYGERRLFEVKGSDWRIGEIVYCPETNLKVRLPKELPPLVAREGEKAGTIWSPYTERLIDVSPEEWEPDGLVQRRGQPLPIRLPSSLPPLEGEVDRNNPGNVESPFARGKPMAVSYDQWKPGALVVCKESGKRFALPGELPEWILEGEAIEDRPGWIRSPHGQRSIFQVKGADWRRGGIITCDETQRKIRLPDKLPPLEAEAIAEKPGWVHTPYLPDRPEVKVPHAKWHPGATAKCPETGIEFRLPEGLPELPVAPQRAAHWELIAAGAAALLIVAAVVAYLVHHKNSQTVAADNGGSTTGGQATASPTMSAASVSNVPAAPAWPATYDIPDGVSPSEATAALLPAPGREPISLDRYIHLNDGGRIQSIDLADIMRQLPSGATAPSIVFSAPGYEPVSEELKKVTSGHESAPGGGISLTLIRGKVAVAGDMHFWSCYYDDIVLTPNSPNMPEEVRDTPYKISLSGGSGTPPAGTYSVELKPLRADEAVAIKLTDNLQVQADSVATINLPPSLPRYMGGILESPDAYQNITFWITSDQNQTDNRQGPLFSPCVITFNSNFSGGTIYTENIYLGPLSLLVMDNMVRALAENETQKPQPNYPHPTTTETYAAWHDKMQSLLNTELNPQLGDDELKDLANRHLQLAQTVKDLNTAIEKSGLKMDYVDNGKKYDFGPAFQWMVGLSDALSQDNGSAWTQLGSVVMSGSGWNSMDWGSLTNPVGTGGRSLAGVFVPHNFQVTGIDENGTVSISTKLVFEMPWNLEETQSETMEAGISHGQNEIDMSGEIRGTGAPAKVSAVLRPLQ